jgi:hypothetical protein
MIHYSVGQNTFDNHPVNETAETFRDFQERVLALRSPRKGMTYVAAPFNGDGRRKKEGALPREWLPLDFDLIDGPETFQDVCLYLSRYDYFGYTTASHTEAKPRARAIINASRDMTREECRRVGLVIQAELEARFGAHIQLDASVYRSEQPVFTPVTTSKIWRSDGEPLDVDELLAKAPPAIEEYRADQRAAAIAEGDPVLTALAARNMIKKELSAGKFAVHCPCGDSHTSVSGDTATVYLLPNFGGVRFGKFHCLHSHCENREQGEFLQALDLDPKTVWALQSGREPEEAAKKTPKTEEEPPKRPKKERFRPKKARDLLCKEMPELMWVIPSILPAGVTLLVAPPKAGKSYLAMDMGVSIAAGGYMFGRIQCDPGATFYMALEDNERRIKRRLNESLRGGKCPADFYYETSSPRLDEDLAADLDALLQEFDYRLIIVDTIKMIRSEEKNGDKVYNNDYAVGRPFIELAAKHPKTAFVLIHHTNKNKSDDVLDLISGSNGLAGGVDNVWALQRPRGGNEAVLHVTGRDVVESRFELYWDSEVKQWTMTDEGPHVGMSPERKKVFVAIREHGPIRGPELAALLYPGATIVKGCKEWNAVYSLCGKLRNAGLIEWTDDGYLVRE